MDRGLHRRTISRVTIATKSASSGCWCIDMGKLINYEKAQEFLDSISDPIVESLIDYAHGNLFTENLLDEAKGDFDLLVFYKSLELLLRDRERLIRVLNGELTH